MTDCQRNPVVNFGQKDLALRVPTGRSFARVTVASVAKNLLSVSSLLKTGHEVVFSATADSGEEWGLSGELRSLSVRCGFKLPPCRDE